MIILTHTTDLEYNGGHGREDNGGCGDGRGDDWIELAAGLISMVAAANLILEMSQNQKNLERW